MLGLHPRGGTVDLDPCLPGGVERIHVSQLNAYGKLWEIEATGTSGRVRLAQ